MPRKIVDIIWVLATLHYLLILPTVKTLVTSFGKNPINYDPKSAAVLTTTNGYGRAEEHPLILHNILRPLATECTVVGQYKEARGGIKFDPVTRLIDVTGTGVGQTEQFHLYLFGLDPNGNVQDEELSGCLSKYYHDEERIRKSKKHMRGYLDEVNESYEGVIKRIFLVFDRDDFTF